MPKHQYVTLLLLSSCLCVQACAPDLPFAALDKSNISLPSQFPEYGPPQMGTPAKGASATKTEDIKTGDTSAASGTPSDKSTAAPVNAADTQWKDFFNDSHLNSLIETALKNNQELHILEQENYIAQNEIMARRGEYLPRLGIGGNFEVEKVGEHTSRGATEAGTEFLPVEKVPHQLRNRSIGLTSSWEVDIWKRLRNSAKSASLKYKASVEGRNFMITQLVAEIADSYYELLALDRQLIVVKKYISTLKQAQQVVEYQMNAGRANELAVKRFEAEVQKNQSREYEIQKNITLTENRLNNLVGRLPQPIERDPAQFSSLLPQKIQAGIPSALLENRPDVKEAILDLEATKLDVKAAKARFYPGLSIEANAGYEAFNASHFLKTPESLFYNAAAGLTAPLLNRMAIKADYFSANNKQIQAVYHYERTLITAYTEVANQLVTIDNLDKICRTKSKQVKAMSDSVDISNMLFKAARIDYLESLLTQRDYLEAEMDFIEARQQQLTSYVNLYKALGGGWRSL